MNAPSRLDFFRQLQQLLHFNQFTQNLKKFIHKFSFCITIIGKNRMKISAVVFESIANRKRDRRGSFTNGIAKMLRNREWHKLLFFLWPLHYNLHILLILLMYHTICFKCKKCDNYDLGWDIAVHYQFGFAVQNYKNWTVYHLQYQKTH